MLRGVEKLHRELARISRPRSAVITPTPGGPPMEVSVGDEVEFTYQGEPRRVLILAITDRGIRGRDRDRQALRAFHFERMEGVIILPPAKT